MLGEGWDLDLFLTNQVVKLPNLAFGVIVTHRTPKPLRLQFVWTNLQF